MHIVVLQCIYIARRYINCQMIWHACIVTYCLYLRFFSSLSNAWGTHSCSSVQSACTPHNQPVDGRLTSHTCRLRFFIWLWPWPLHRQRGESLLVTSHGHTGATTALSWLLSSGRGRKMFSARWRPNSVPPVFWMCTNTMTLCPLASKSYRLSTTSSVKAVKLTSDDDASKWLINLEVPAEDASSLSPVLTAYDSSIRLPRPNVNTANVHKQLRLPLNKRLVDIAFKLTNVNLLFLRHIFVISSIVTVEHDKMAVATS